MTQKAQILTNQKNKLNFYIIDYKQYNFCVILCHLCYLRSKTLLKQLQDSETEI
jgi:hypothetical protein